MTRSRWIIFSLLILALLCGAAGAEKGQSSKKDSDSLRASSDKPAARPADERSRTQPSFNGLSFARSASGSAGKAGEQGSRDRGIYNSQNASGSSRNGQLSLPWAAKQLAVPEERWREKSGAEKTRLPSVSPPGVPATEKPVWGSWEKSAGPRPQPALPTPRLPHEPEKERQGMANGGMILQWPRLGATGGREEGEKARSWEQKEREQRSELPLRAWRDLKEKERGAPGNKEERPDGRGEKDRGQEAWRKEPKAGRIDTPSDKLHPPVWRVEEKQAARQKDRERCWEAIKESRRDSDELRFRRQEHWRCHPWPAPHPYYCYLPFHPYCFHYRPIWDFRLYIDIEDIWRATLPPEYAYRSPKIAEWELWEAEVWAADGTFLGIINDNPYDYDSLANPEGPYGDRWSPRSIWNHECPYGAFYSALSAWDPDSWTPPRIYRGERFVAYLTMNPDLYPRVTPLWLARWLRLYDYEHMR